MSTTDDKVFFFDAGGTLLRPARSIGWVYAQVASHYGPLPDAELLEKGFRTAWKAMKPRDPVAGARVMDDKSWWRDLVLGAWEEVPRREEFPFDDYFEEVYQAFERPEQWRVFPDASSVLPRLREKGIRCAVLSNWDRRLRTILEGLDLAGYFEEIIISSECGVEKPHPRLFKIAQEKMNVEPGQAVLIGDDDYFDGEGGKAAGWEVRLVRRPEVDLGDILAGTC